MSPSLAELILLLHCARSLFDKVMAEPRAPSTPRDTASLVVGETIAIGTSNAAAAVLATAVLEVGTSIPLVSLLVVLLKQVKDEVDRAVRRVEELNELHAHCCIITAQVIDKYHDVTSLTFDLSPLHKLIEDLNEVARDCGEDRSFLRYLRLRHHGDRIRMLRERIDRLVPILGLAAGVNISSQLEAGLQRIVSVMGMCQRRISWFTSLMHAHLSESDLPFVARFTILLHQHCSEGSPFEELYV